MRRARRPGARRRAASTALDAGDFENHCPVCGRPLAWALVDEDARLDPRSSYAASKVAQEHYAAAWARQARRRGGRAEVPQRLRPADAAGHALLRGRRDVPLRRSSEGEPPQVFEDGGQMRDFVHVDDVARANLLALRQVVDAPRRSRFTAYNVCSGQPVPIRRRRRAGGRGHRRATSSPRSPAATGSATCGTSSPRPERARARLGFTAQVGPEEGLPEFATAPLR